MSASTIVNQKFFGLVELDTDGTVRYSRIEREGHQYLAVANITGRNFYSEVARFQNVEEFRKCLESFRRSSQQASTIPFTCQYEDGPLRVKVLLARVRERSEGDVSRSILVHIGKAQ
jgi:hypothetical protein